MHLSIAAAVAMAVGCCVFAALLTDVELSPSSRKLWPRSFRYRRLLNWLPLGVGYAFWYAARYNVAAGNVASVRNRVGLSEASFGAVLTSGFWTYAITAPFTGTMVDSRGGAWGAKVACAGSAAANAMLGFWFEYCADDFAPSSRAVIFAFLYSLNIFFQGFGTAAVTKINASWYTETERGIFSGVFNVLLSSGYYFALGAGGTVINELGWPSVFLLPAGVLAVISICIAAMVSDAPPRRPQPPPLSYGTLGSSGVADGDGALLRTPKLDEIEGVVSVPEILGQYENESPFVELMQNRSFAWFCASIFCLCWVRDGLLAWLYSFIEESRGHPLSGDTTAMLGGAVTLGGFVGGVLCGWLSDAVCGSSRVMPVIVFSGGQVFALASLWYGARDGVGDTCIAGIAFILCTFILGSYTVLSYTVPLDLPPRLVGSAAGAATAIGYSASGCAGAAMGILIQHWGYAGWLWSLGAATCGCALCAAAAGAVATPESPPVSPSASAGTEGVPRIGTPFLRPASASAMSTRRHSTAAVFVVGADVVPVWEEQIDMQTYLSSWPGIDRDFLLSSGRYKDPSSYFYRRRTLAERVRDVAEECGDTRHDRFLLQCSKDPNSVFNTLPKSRISPGFLAP